VLFCLKKERANHVSLSRQSNKRPIFFKEESALQIVADTLYYSAVVDAGSSGSRLRLYSSQKSNENLMSDLVEVYDNEVSPGLQDVAQQELEAYLSS
jgi:hypothetical protein